MIIILQSPLNAGKVFYNLGKASDLVFTYKLYKNVEFQDLKIVNDDIITQLQEATGDNREKFTKLLNIWENINESEISKKITIENETLSDGFFQLVTVNLSEAFPLFPYEQEFL